MDRRVRLLLRTAIVLAVVLVVAGCGPADTAPDRRISVTNASGNGLLYPGQALPCDPTMRCRELRAEIDRWAARAAPDHGPIVEVSFHTFVDDAGQSIIMTRSGGGTYLAIVTFGGGEQIGLKVGCGIGIDADACFASP
jgi:hypothetical protein